MAQNEISDYDETDASNVDITGIDVQENVMRPPAVNNAFRALQGALKRWFKASLFRLRDGTDQTKLLAFDLSGLTTATTRTLTVQNTSGTIALTGDIATQAEMESASSATKFVTAGRQHFHPAMPKAVVRINNLGVASPTVVAAFTSLGTVTCSRASTGVYTVSWVNAISGGNHFFQVADSNAGRIANLTAATSTSIGIKVTTDTGSASDPDIWISLQLFGDLA